MNIKHYFFWSRFDNCFHIKIDEYLKYQNDIIKDEIIIQKITIEQQRANRTKTITIGTTPFQKINVIHKKLNISAIRRR